MTVAPPARGHAPLPPSDCWPEVCARSAGASACYQERATFDRSQPGPEVCDRSERAANTQSISIFLRVVDSTLWKKVTVNSVVKDLGTVNLRYGDLNGDNKVEVVQGTFPNETVIGDGLVYENSAGGLITPLSDAIYVYDWRADFDRNLFVNGDDYNALYAIKSGNTIGDSLE